MNKKRKKKKSKGVVSIRGAGEGVSFFSEEKNYSTFPGAPCHSDDIEFRRSRRREFGEPPRVLGVLCGFRDARSGGWHRAIPCFPLEKRIEVKKKKKEEEK